MPLASRGLRVGLVLISVLGSSQLVYRGTRRGVESLTLAQAIATTALPSVTASAKPDFTRHRKLDELLERDRGPYLDLASWVRIAAPVWLLKAPAEFVVDSSSGFCFRYVEGVAVEVCQSQQAPTMRISGLGDDDLDGDGIPTALDILIGAKKTVLLATPYIETYRVLDYPNGDMPRREGVCTDVVIRALRNAGYDLQSLVSNDRASAPKAYPAIAKPDRNIDHRRVRNLLVYFQRHFEALSLSSTFLPGDVIFFDTMGDSRPEHLGVVSNQVGKSGRPLIINSWTTGYVTSEMDLLPTVPATHRFRVKAPATVPMRPGTPGDDN